MSNNNVTINQPNNPYGQPINDNNPYGQPIMDNNKQNKFLGHLLRHSSDIIPAEPIVRNQLRKAEQFTIGGEDVYVPGEYAKAFKALYNFWYNDMLGDYLKGENNGYSDSSWSMSNYLTDWKNEIDFFLKNLAIACSNRNLSPEYLNILVYNENYGIIHLKKWLVPFCRSCVDKNGILKELMCEKLEAQHDKKCPNYACQTQQNWKTSSNPITHESKVEEGVAQTLSPGSVDAIQYQNEGANFVLKIALEKYLKDTSKSNANSTISTQELQKILYNFKIASQQCKQGLLHGENNTLINQNTTDIPYDFNYTLPNDNPTVTEPEKDNIGVKIGVPLGLICCLAAVGITQYCRHKGNGLPGVLKGTCDDIKSICGKLYDKCCKKKENETKKRNIKNKKEATNKGNGTVTVKVGNDQNTLTSKEDFIKNKKKETVNNKDENDIEEEINTEVQNNVDKQGNNSQATGNISNILNKSDLDDIAKQLNAGKEKHKEEMEEKNNKEDKSNNFAERPGESELQKQMVEHMEEVNKNKYEQNQAEINNDDNINLDKEELDKYAGRQNSK